MSKKNTKGGVALGLALLAGTAAGCYYLAKKAGLRLEVDVKKEPYEPDELDLELDAVEQELEDLELKQEELEQKKDALEEEQLRRQMDLTAEDNM